MVVEKEAVVEAASVMGMSGLGPADGFGGGGGNNSGGVSAGGSGGGSGVGGRMTILFIKYPRISS